jgi:hypothetical protein
MSQLHNSRMRAAAPTDSGCLFGRHANSLQLKVSLQPYAVVFVAWWTLLWDTAGARLASSAWRIKRFGWYDVTDSAAWFRYITVVSRNYVQMNMEHCLPGSRAYIDTDIVSVRSTALLDHTTDLRQQIEQRLPFLPR